MSVAYLEKLNPEQRRAVEHGVREKACAPSAPLLVIAGKTAWPVIVAGSASVRDPSQGVRVDVSARMRGMWR